MVASVILLVLLLLSAVVVSAILNSSTYTAEQVGFKLKVPMKWREFGFVVSTSTDQTDGFTRYKFTILAADESGERGPFSVVGSVAAVPLEDFPIECDGRPLCDPGVEVGRNDKYVFVSEPVSPEAFGICENGAQIDDGAFAKRNARLCASRLDLTSPERVRSAFQAFDI